MSKRSDGCPYLKNCKFRVTKFFFVSLCLKEYNKCKHFAKRNRKLDTPINWMIKMSVEQTSSK